MAKKIHPNQMDMFAGVDDFGKPIDRESKGRWYVITRKWNTEALYLVDGRHEWREYDPLTSVPHAFNTARQARRVAVCFKGASVREWPYGVLRPGRSK